MDVVFENCDFFNVNFLGVIMYWVVWINCKFVGMDFFSSRM